MKNYPENSSKTKFEEDFTKKFCKSFTEHAMDIINFFKENNEVINKGKAEIM